LVNKFNFSELEPKQPTELTCLVSIIDMVCSREQIICAKLASF